MKITGRKLFVSLSVLSMSMAMIAPRTVIAEESPYGEINGDPIVSEVELTLEKVDEPEETETLTAAEDLDIVKVVVELEAPCAIDQGLEPGSAAAEAYAQKLKSEQVSVMSRVEAVLEEKATSLKKAGAQKSAEAIAQSVRGFRTGIQLTNVMNAFVVSVPRGMMRELNALEGVKRVFESVKFSAPETVDGENEAEMSFSKGMIGAGLVNESGYDGRGLVIGVMDTGLDLYHSAFAQDPAEPKYTADTKFNLSFGSETYKNLKVPYAYDYGDMDPDVIPVGIDSNASHGTHVAGITSGKDVGFEGVAPEAQLAIFKIFADNSRWTYDYQIAMGLEDAVAVKPDVLNLSIGAPSGGKGELEYANYEGERTAIGEIFQRVYDSGIPISISGGNESYMTLNGSWNSTPHLGITSSPGSYMAPVSTASIENAGYTERGLYTSAGDILFYDPSENPETRFISLIKNGEKEYVSCNLGTAEDFNSAEVSGKIALVKNGEISVMEKQANAAAAGAVAMIVYNDKKGSVPNMIIDSDSIPCISTAMEYGEKLEASETKYIYNGYESSYSNGGTPHASQFSSWGTTDDLRMKPEIAAPGGGILSSVVGGYEAYSGTSMAAPHLAAAMALVRQYAKENGLGTTEQELDRITVQLLMSTARPVSSYGDKANESVRHVGAGLININAAMAAHAYLSVDNTADQRPKLELGDDPEKTGVYPFSFKVTNISDSPMTYKVSADAVRTERMSVGMISSVPTEIDFSTVSSITVPAHATAEVSGTIALGADTRTAIENTATGSGFVDGYIYLDPSADSLDGTQLSIPYLVFYGDWEALPVLDVTLEHGKDYINGINGLVPFDTYNYMTENSTYTYQCRMIGMNPQENRSQGYENWSGNYYFDNYDRKYMVTTSLVHPDLIGYENPAVQVADLQKHVGVYSVGLSLLKNINQYRIIITDANTGKTYHDSGEVTGLIRKAQNQTGSDNYADCMVLWPATDENGQPLAEDTQVNVEVIVSTDGGVHTESMILPLTIDNTAPYIAGAQENEETGVGTFSTATLVTTAGGVKYLKFNAQDNYFLAAAKVCADLSGVVNTPYAEMGDESIAGIEQVEMVLENVTDQKLFFGEEKNELNNVLLDVTDLSEDSMYVALYDYANLASYYKVSTDKEETMKLKLSPAETTLKIGSGGANLDFEVTDADGYPVNPDRLSCELVNYDTWESYVNSYRKINLHVSSTETESELTVKVSYTDDPDTYATAVVHLEYDPTIEVVGKTLSLDGKIGLNFYVDIPEEYVEGLTARLIRGWRDEGKVEIPVSSVPERTVTVGGQQRKVRVFGMQTAAKEMRDDIQLDFYSTGTDTFNPSVVISYNDGGTVRKTLQYRYTVEDYLETAMSTGSEKLQPLAQKLNDYGKYAQYYFDYNTYSIRYSPDDNTYVTADDLAPYAEKTEGSVTGLKYAGSTLELEADTLFRLYFTPESGHKISEYTFTIDGKKAVPVQRSAGSSYYYVTVDNIAGKDLGTARTIKASKGNEEMTISYSALSYAYKALTSDSTEEPIRNVVRALYLYNLDAIEYFKN